MRSRRPPVSPPDVQRLALVVAAGADAAVVALVVPAVRAADALVAPLPRLRVVQVLRAVLRPALRPALVASSLLVRVLRVADALVAVVPPVVRVADVVEGLAAHRSRRGA